MENAKPCPFCGGEDAYITSSAKDVHFMQCECGGEGPGGSTEDEGIGLWNQREPYQMLLSERDELWAAMQRVALNLCDCDARDGDECPVYPVEHRDHCAYACAHAPQSKDEGPIDWDDVNFSIASGEESSDA